MRRFAAAMLALVAALAALGGATAAHAHPNDVVPEADWLLSLQIKGGIDRGLIPANAGDDYCVPYFANSAAQGLAAATQYTHDTKYVNAAWDWLDWYSAHMDASGFVTNYRWAGSRWVTTGTMDSTDGYAGTFLVAVRDAYIASGDTARLDALWPGVVKAVAAMVATDNGAYLTYAKPGYLQLFLMDNIEVYEGFRAVEYLAGSVHPDATLREVAGQWTASMPAAFDAYWNSSQQGYDIAISNTGVRYMLDWQTLYPAVAAQAWMLRTGLVPASRAPGLAAKIDATHPDWDASGLSSGAGWWPEVIEGMRFAGASARAESGLTTMVTDVLATGRAWPYHVGNAGLLIKEMIGTPETLMTAGPGAYTTSLQSSMSFQGIPSITGGGTVTFQCSVDGSAFAPCVSPSTVVSPGDGLHVFSVQAIDNGGTVVDPTPASFPWTIDSTPPVPVITATPAMPGNAAPVFGFAATDNATPSNLITFECAVDGGTFAPCRSPATLSIVGTKTHTMQLRATDRAGNRSNPYPNPAYSWFADATRPDTQLTSGPIEGSVHADGAADFAFTGSDPDGSVVTFECKVGSEAFAPCTSPVHRVAGEGTWTFQVRSTDAVGNADLSPATRTWIVDRTAPDTGIVIHPTAISRNRDQPFSFSGSDNIAGGITFECSLDGAPFARCTSPKSYTNLAATQHSFQVRAIDGAGYVDPTPARWDWMIDLGAPAVSFTTNDNAVIYPAEPAFSGVVSGIATDDLSGVASVQLQFVSTGTSRGIVFVDATIDCSDSSRRNCTWSAKAPVGPAVFRVYARAVDVATNPSANPPANIAVIVP